MGRQAGTRPGSRNRAAAASDGNLRPTYLSRLASGLLLRRAVVAGVWGWRRTPMAQVRHVAFGAGAERSRKADKYQRPRNTPCEFPEGPELCR